MHALVTQLMNSLNLDAPQAEGGAGLFFNVIKDHLDGGDFGKILSQVDGVQELLKKAPDTNSGLGGMLGGLASKVGGDQAASLVELTAGLKKLDIDLGQLDDLVEVGLKFLQQEGGSELVDLVKGLVGK